MGIKTFTEYLTETTLSRVWSTFNEPGVAGIISASRQGRKPEDNTARTIGLAQKVRAAGYGYVFVDGSWVEKSETGEDVPFTETSVVIRGGTNDNGRLKGYLRKWIREYDQEGCLYKPQNESIVIVMTNNGTETRVGYFQPEIAASLMTKLRGRGDRSLVFENAYTAMGWVERLLVHRSKTSLQVL